MVAWESRRLELHRWLLLAAMLIAHVALYWLGANGVGTPMWDLNNVYAPWVSQIAQTGQLPGITVDWIYPFPDLLPLLAASIIAPANYQLGWVIMVGVLNLVALSALLGWRAKPTTQSLAAGWFWVVGMLLLGPVSISRLDAVSVALAVLAVSFLVRGKNGSAGSLMALATWVKIWPVAFFFALIGDRSRFKRSALIGGATGVGILLVGLLIAKPQALFSFAGGQLTRGIQIEAPVALPWLWVGLQDPINAGIRFSHELLTFQVFGPFAAELAKLMDYVQLFALAITIYLAYSAGKMAQKESRSYETVLVWGFLTAVLDLISFNKVGSPQYYAWLLVPTVLALVWQVPRAKALAAAVLVTCGLTGLVFPVFYDQLLRQDLFATSLLSVRNIVLIALLVWSNVELTKLTKSSTKTREAA